MYDIVCEGRVVRALGVGLLVGIGWYEMCQMCDLDVSSKYFVQISAGYAMIP